MTVPRTTSTSHDRDDGRSGTEWFLSAALACVCAGVLTLIFSWSFLSDPATATLSESDELRDELRSVRVVPVGEFVLLNDSSEYRWTLGPGFAPSESDGTWVRSRAAQIIFYPKGVPEGSEDDLVLELSVSPLLVGDLRTRTLRVNSGREEVEVELADGGKRVIVALPTGEEQVVDLLCDSLDVPAEDPGIADLRRLCVKVYAMAIRVDSERLKG